jgi:hypothetical protein
MVKDIDQRTSKTSFASQDRSYSTENIVLRHRCHRCQDFYTVIFETVSSIIIKK